MVKRFLSSVLALSLCFSFLFLIPSQSIFAVSEEAYYVNDVYNTLEFSEESFEFYKAAMSCIDSVYSSIPSEHRKYSIDHLIPVYCYRYDSTYYYIRFYYSLKTRIIYTSSTLINNINHEYSLDLCLTPDLLFSDCFFSSNFNTNHTKISTSDYSTVFLPFTYSVEPSDLTFSLSPDICLDMDLDSVQNSLTVSVDNRTEKAYDYMLYVSSTPAATSLTSSLYNMNFASSSKQWCYTKQSDSSVPPDLQQLIKDNASDTFTTSTIIDTLYPGSTGVLFNVWGSQFKAYSEYLSYKEDHITFYSLSQTNCPIYLINREDSRSHVIPFSSFNIEMGKTYYFNIIYREHDQTVVGALGTSTTALLAAGNGQYSYPVYDTSQFTSYQNYSSTEFSVTNGMVSNPQKDDLTDFHSVAYYSNPDNSTAYITNDNSVNINNSFNSGSGSGSGDGGYDPSCSTNYINHGVIYHGCTIYNSPSGSGSGSGSSGLSVPDLPEFEFTELYEKSGGFFDFVKLVIENSGWIPVTIFSSLCLVVLFCRIWGR